MNVANEHQGQWLSRFGNRHAGTNVWGFPSALFTLALLSLLLYTCARCTKSSETPAGLYDPRTTFTPDSSLTKDDTGSNRVLRTQQTTNAQHPPRGPWKRLKLDSARTLADVYTPNKEPALVSPSGMCHILLLYGLGDTDLTKWPRGKAALRILSNETAAKKTFGDSPFIRTRYGLRYYSIKDPLGRRRASEAHRDQCLATFAELNLPINTPIRLDAGKYSILDLLREAAARFRIEQEELAWTSLAFAHYFPPRTKWANMFGTVTSFSELTSELLERRFSSGSCAGIHIFQALLAIKEADEKDNVLVKPRKRELRSFLKTTVNEAARTQNEDGSWDTQWCGEIESGGHRKGEFETRILVTGHLLEALTETPAHMRPAKSVYVRGRQWLEVATRSTKLKANSYWYCPVTHACNALNSTNQARAERRLSK